MKRLVLVALLCVLLGAVAFAETEDEARAALQNTLMELRRRTGAELVARRTDAAQLPDRLGGSLRGKRAMGAVCRRLRAMPGRPKAFGAAQYGLTWASTRPKKG